MKEATIKKSTETLINSAEKLYYKNKFAEAIDYLNQAEVLIKNNPDVLDSMKVTNLKGMIFFKQGAFDIAEDLFLQSLSYSKLTGETRYIYNRYDNLAALYISTKRFRYAIDYLQKAIKLKESAGSQQDLARGYIQLASLFFTIDNFESGKSALKNAQVFIRQYKQRPLLMHWHMAMGMQYKREGNYKSALAEYTKAVKYGTEFNDPFVIARAYSNQGDILMQQQRWDESEKKYLESLQLAKQSNMLIDELSVSIQLAAIALEKRDFAWCRTLFEYVSRKVVGIENDILRKDLMELSAKLHKGEGHYQAALDAYQKYIEYYKKFYDNEMSRTVLDIQAKYENEKKEKELQKVKLQQVESQLKTLSAQRALMDSELRFRALIENGTDMIYIVNERLQPTYASPAAYHILGYEENEYLAKTVPELLHPDDLPVILEKINLCVQNPGVPIYGQIRLPRKGGGYIWAEGSATNLLHIPAAAGIVCNLRDITERKQAEEALRELNESLEKKIAERTSELQEANRGLESFSYSVSHDLRTPLRIISGYSSLLSKKYGGQLDEDANVFIKTIVDNANHMSHLIDDLLNLSRLGRQDLEKTTIDMTQIATQIVSDLLADENPGQIEITINDINHAQADPGLIKQVWQNLISNAVKYSRKTGRPRIEIGSTIKKKEHIYHIKDNGAGFDMAHVDKLFGAFQRLHDKGEYEGTGVGLAIVHRIITKHGGRIWAEAKVNKGATFYFTLGE